MSPPEGGAGAQVLDPDLRTGRRPQLVVPALWRQAAVSLGAWPLVGRALAPGFEFASFELAPPDRPAPTAA